MTKGEVLKFMLDHSIYLRPGKELTDVKVILAEHTRGGRLDEGKALEALKRNGVVVERDGGQAKFPG